MPKSASTTVFFRALSVVSGLGALVACEEASTGAYHDGCADGALCGGTNGGGGSTGDASVGGQAAGGTTGGAAAGGQAAGGATGGQAGGGSGGDATGGTGGSTGGAEVGGSGGAGGAVPTGERIGGECVEPTDCASGFCLDSAFAQSVAMDDTVEVPGGYCTDLSCQASADCRQDDASCIDLGATGIDIPFNACFQTCDPVAEPSVCRADQTCYCDPEGDITDTESNRGLCLCLPEVLVGLLSGE